MQWGNLTLGRDNHIGGSDPACGGGTLELDTNASQIRPIALTWTNALFAGHEIGAENEASMASFVATYKISYVNPVDYLAATLRDILDSHLQSGIKYLMPWRFNQPSSLAA